MHIATDVEDDDDDDAGIIGNTNNNERLAITTMLQLKHECSEATLAATRYLRHHCAVLDASLDEMSGDHVS